LRPLEIAGVASFMAVPVAVMAGLDDHLLAALMGLAGAIQIARVSGWRSGFAARQPILWSLHLSFALIGLGYAMTGLALLGLGSEVAALHVTAIGGVAGMTLAVMSRAALGHSGRPLQAPALVAAAYVLVPLAAVLRWIGSEFGGSLYFPTVVGAGLLWTLAFVFFAIGLWPAFWGPRVSGKA
jgi:uncharacterized protein involved in response to NO